MDVQGDVFNSGTIAFGLGAGKPAAKVLDDAVAAVEKQFGKAAAERFKQEARRKQVIEK